MTEEETRLAELAITFVSATQEAAKIRAEYNEVLDRLKVANKAKDDAYNAIAKALEAPGAEETE